MRLSEFEEMISSDSDLAHKEEKLRLGLMEYCRQDTLVMAELVKWLFVQAENHGKMAGQL